LCTVSVLCQGRPASRWRGIVNRGTHRCCVGTWFVFGPAIPRRAAASLNRCRRLPWARS